MQRSKIVCEVIHCKNDYEFSRKLTPDRQNVENNSTIFFFDKAKELRVYFPT
jgi:hypothetical protein